MADRFVVSEVQQIGVESTAGTGVTPTIQFAGLNIDLGTEIEFDEFKPSGQLPQAIVAPRQEWAAGSLSGYPTYTEIAYALSNIFGAATITTPSGATNARKWVWTPDESTPWTPKTWTIRRGVPSGTAEEANYALLSGLSLMFSRTAAPEIGGDLFARRLDYAATLATTGITTRNNVPILPTQVDLYLDSASGSLGGTQLTRDFMFSWSISGLFDMIWPLNSSLTSFSAHSIKAPAIEAKLQMGNDATGASGMVTTMRAGSTVWVRLLAQAAASSIESGQRYSLTIDLPLKVVSAPSRDDVNGLSTLEWTFRNVYDSSWGKWINIELITDFAAL